jgi:hypothetical protein
MKTPLIAIIIACFLSAPSLALSITQLIYKAPTYDKHTITITGEVIGDVMLRGKNAWVNISDRKTAVGVWMDKNLSDKISVKGDYRHQGDQIEVTGIFYQSGVKHGGDLYIEAEEINILSAGKAVPYYISHNRVWAAIILAAVSLIALFLKLLLKR